LTPSLRPLDTRYSKNDRIDNEITDLEVQIDFPCKIITVEGKEKHICKYVADFRYKITMEIGSSRTLKESSLRYSASRRNSLRRYILV
jgi:hypothetical protein